MEPALLHARTWACAHICVAFYADAGWLLHRTIGAIVGLMAEVAGIAYFPASSLRFLVDRRSTDQRR